MYQGIVYDIDVACNAHIVISVAAGDPKFQTADGLTVRSTMRDALKAGGVVVPETGEGGNPCELVLPSGWIVTFGSCEESPTNIVQDFAKRLSDDEIEAILGHAHQAEPTAASAV